jgi:hypothetical protein
VVETPLGYQVDQKEIDRLILAGQDAYVRHIPISVPRDAVAHIHQHLADAALEMMELNLDADLATAAECSFGASG